MKGNAMTKTESNVIDLACKFTSVAFDSGVSVGVHVEKGKLSPSKAESILCGRRLDCKLKAAGNGDDPDQMEFDGMESLVTIEGSADANSFSSNPKGIGSRLHFNKNDIDASEFVQLAEHHGRILIRGVGDIPEVRKPKFGGGQKALGPWRDQSVDVLEEFGAMPSILTALGKAGLDTIGAVADHTKAGKPLVDIDGIGPKMAERLESALAGYWKANPIGDDDDESETE
jgi:hypothetical protein